MVRTSCNTYHSYTITYPHPHPSPLISFFKIGNQKVFSIQSRFLSYELHFWSKMYFLYFRTLTNLLGLPRFSLLRDRFLIRKTNWPSYLNFNFLSYELHRWPKMYFFSFRTVTNQLGWPKFSVLRGRFCYLNKNWPSYEYFKFLSYELH